MYAHVLDYIIHCAQVTLLHYMYEALCTCKQRWDCWYFNFGFYATPDMYLSAAFHPPQSKIMYPALVETPFSTFSTPLSPIHQIFPPPHPPPCPTLSFPCLLTFYFDKKIVLANRKKIAFQHWEGKTTEGFFFFLMLLLQYTDNGG